MNKILGIDIGGSGIKGAVVDIQSGVIFSDRIRIPTPVQSSPLNVIEVIQYIIERLEYSGSVGVGFPGPVKNGVIMRAINLSPDWKGLNAEQVLKSTLEEKICLINDADAAALAEHRFGDWPNTSDTVIFLTVGTGIGSSIWKGNQFLANTELGHLKIQKKIKFEDYASNRTRKEKELSWKKWGTRFNKILNELDLYFNSPTYIIGGGIAEKKERFAKYIDENISWNTAQLKNDAGIIGAALHCANKMN